MAVVPTDKGCVDVRELALLMERPAPFTPGEPRFWDDPHISKGLLNAHLDPDTEAASRPPATIDRCVAWIVKALELRQGHRVVDLGCGPGLYASRLAERGITVTGVDLSPRSIEMARNMAREHGLDIAYRCQDYLDLTDESSFDAAFLIYGDYCPLAPEKRARLLGNVHRALKAGGQFVLDVTTRRHRQQHLTRNAWYAMESGFWRPTPHLVLEQGFDYPEQSIYLDQYIVIEASGKLSVYRNWFHDYTPATLKPELEAGGFAVLSLWGDLMGTPYTPDSEWIGVVARKVSDVKPLEGK
jgi:SAM-dependent methyltransferase